MDDTRNTVFYRIKTLTRHSMVYGLFDFLGKAGAFVLVPVYTKSLPPSEYGMIELFIVTGSLLLILSVLGFNSALTRYYTTEPDEKERQAFFYTSFQAVAIVGGGIAVLLILLAPGVSILFFDTDSYATYWRILFLTVFIDSLGAMFLSLFRSQSLPVRYSWINLGKLLTTLVANILFVAVFRWGVPGVLAGNLLGSFVGFSLGFVMAGRVIRLRFSTRHFKLLWKFGSPLVVSGFGLFMMNSADRYFLKAYTSLTDVGTYALGYKIGMVMSLVVNAFVVAWPPIMFKISQDTRSRETFSTIMTYFLFATCFLMVGVGSFSVELVTILSTQAYVAASGIILMILASYLLQGVYYILSVGVTVTDKTKVVPFIVGIGTLVNIAGNIALIPRYGIWGAATATVISYAVLPLVMYVVSQRYYKIGYDWRRILFIVFTAASLLACNLLVFETVSLPIIALKALVVCLFPAILYFLGFFSAEERERAKALGKKFLRRWAS